MISDAYMWAVMASDRHRTGDEISLVLRYGSLSNAAYHGKRTTWHAIER